MRFAYVKEYGTIALSSSEQAQAQEKGKVYGDIVGLYLYIGVDTTLGTGVLGTGAVTSNVVNKLTIKDKNGNTLYDFANVTYGVHDFELLGDVLAKRIKGGDAKQIGRTALDANGDGISADLIPLYVNVIDQPVAIDVTFNTLSGILSTVGSGASNVTPKVGFLYDVPAFDMKAGMPTKTSLKSKVYAITGVASGDNQFEKFLPESMLISMTALYGANHETYVSKTTFTSDGLAEFESATVKALNAIEAKTFPDFTHLTGLLFIPHKPYFRSNATNWMVNYSTAENPRVIHVIG